MHTATPVTWYEIALFIAFSLGVLWAYVKLAKWLKKLDDKEFNQTYRPGARPLR